MLVEIPPELVDEIVDAVTAVPGHGPTIQEIVRTTAERLSALWAERLTSDEAITALFLNVPELAAGDPAEKPTLDEARQLRDAMRAAIYEAAALSSVSGKDADAS